MASTPDNQDNGERMAGWGEFITAFMVFLAAHLIPAQPRLRQFLIRHVGRGGYLLGFGMLSLGLFYWLLMAAGRAPEFSIWSQAYWHRWVVNLAMPVAILLGVFATGAPNPFSMGGIARGFDPARPGIIGITRHPLMWAFVIWAGAHLLVNGDLAHVVLFAVFVLFAVSGMWAAERRARLCHADFTDLARSTSFWPLAALLEGRWRPETWPSPWRLGLALLIWAALYHLHPWVIGASPAP